MLLYQHFRYLLLVTTYFKLVLTLTAYKTTSRRGFKTFVAGPALWPLLQAAARAVRRPNAQKVKIQAQW